MTLTDPRLTARINEAQRRLIRGFNYLVRTEQYDSAPLVYTPLVNPTDVLVLDDLDATKLMVLCIWREESNNLDMATALAAKAQALVEQTLQTNEETASKEQWQTILASGAAPNTFGVYKARFGLECPDIGLQYIDARVGRLINEAQRRLALHHNFVIRREEYDAPQVAFSYLTANTQTVLVDDFDATKLMAIGMWRESTAAGAAPDQVSQPETTAYQDQATALLEQNIITAQEAAQKATWQTTLSTGTPGTFGYLKARIGLELADSLLKYSDARVGRFVNAAEESLLMKTKPVGSIQEFVIEVPENGVILLPTQIEAVLYASMHGIAAPVYRQAYDWLESTPGYQTEEIRRARGWADVMVDRGEENGQRRSFIRQHRCGEPVRLLAKLRFLPKVNATDLMVVRNPLALREMTHSLVLASTDVQGSEMHEQKALRLIEEELAEHRGGERAVQNVSTRGTFKPVRRLR